MIPNELVSSDAMKLDFGSFFNLIGVSVEIRDYTSFKKHYYDTMDELKTKYSASNLPNVIKKKTVSKHIPSFSQRDFVKDLVSGLLESDSLTYVQITETYLTKNIDAYNKSYKPSEFMRKFLPHYYPLIPVWRYLNNRQEDKIENFVIDNIDGKITPVWREVGTNAQILYLVPHGDETYPCISLCDLLCEYIRREVHLIRKKEIEDYFKDNFPSIEMSVDSVGDPLVENFTPKYPYSINPQNHYPHPVIFIESSEVWFEKEDKNIRKAIIEDSQIFRLSLDYAEKHGGCVTFLDVMNHQRIFEKGDIILCLDEKAYERSERLVRLNKTKGIELIKVEDVYTIFRE